MRLVKAVTILSILALSLFLTPVPTNAVAVPRETLDTVDRNVVKIIYSWTFNDIYGDSYVGSTQIGGVIIAPNKILSVFHAALERPRGVFSAHVPTDKGDKKKWTKLTLIKHDRLKDLVLLHVEKPISWEPIKLAGDIKWGEDIIIAGYSMIPYPKIRLGKLTTKYFPKMNRTDILISPSYYGDSGGGIFNINGELLGIISHSFSSMYKNMAQDPLCSYAVSLGEINEFLSAKEKKIKTEKDVRRKQFKKEFMEWLESPEIQKFFKEYKKNHKIGYNVLLRFLKEQLK